MSDPVVESMAEVRNHLADVIDRARRDETPTIITRRGKQEAVVIDIDEYQRLRQIAEDAEEAWLNRLADEAESEGVEGYRLTELQKAMDTGDTAAFDTKALQGHSARWRLRVGDCRVVYTAEDGQLIVWVLAPRTP
ncbi:type II toxin-antitoxin system prevent-host-death family antitoxin [Nonomuraea sp. SYSU D8015]|uniref:type II toxin-antitoxin system prevent-host-death family antitoxin n=1 Tax=Nonomuraea sp. SYSU D8015 TaxID=2593644 RepID=UPI001CB71F89|nr:type II toxin-antitoxin system prevent-host-death family antitoxin [Nonomuraea sp. SYSU D8015]